MVILRCTNKLQKRLGIKPAKTNDNSTNQMGDWSCNLIRLGRTQLILCVNHTTRLPIFIPAAPAKQFPERLGSTLYAVLKALDIPSHLVEKECAEYTDFTLAKTNNRSATGSLVDFAKLAPHYALSSDPIDLIHLSLRLAETPCTPLQYKSPNQSVRQLFQN